MTDETTPGLTTRCADCDGVVSRRAVTCPHCGAPLRQPAGYYPDPENPDRMRHWDGNAWAPTTTTSTSPKGSWNRGAILAGFVALGFLPWMLLALFIALLTARNSEEVAGFILLFFAVAYSGVVVVTSIWALREILRNGGRGKALVIVILIVGAVVFLQYLRALLGAL